MLRDVQPDRLFLFSDPEPDGVSTIIVDAISLKRGPVKRWPDTGDITIGTVIIDIPFVRQRIAFRIR